MFSSVKTGRIPRMICPRQPRDKQNLESFDATEKLGLVNTRREVVSLWNEPTTCTFFNDFF